MTLTTVDFWVVDFPVSEVINASHKSLFRITNLKQLSSFKGKLYETDRGTYIFEFISHYKKHFIEFKD